MNFYKENAQIKRSAAIKKILTGNRRKNSKENKIPLPPTGNTQYTYFLHVNASFCAKRKSAIFLDSDWLSVQTVLIKQVFEITFFFLEISWEHLLNRNNSDLLLNVALVTIEVHAKCNLCLTVKSISFSHALTDRPTDRRTDGPTDRRTDELTE